MNTSGRGLRRGLIGVVAAVAASGIAPAAAGAVTVQVTGDNGLAIPIGGAVTIRNLTPDVSLGLTSGENYAFSVTGPSGAPAASGVPCSTSSPTTSVNYLGNGTYTVDLVQYAAADTSCSAPVGTSSVSFTIAGSVPVASPAARALTRAPGSFITTNVPFKVALNPGAVGNQVFYGHNSPLAADGSLAKPAGELFADGSTGTVAVPLDKGPGAYVVVARAEGFNLAGDVFTPWSPPAGIRAFDPFDLATLTFPDRRGPIYSLHARVRSNAARGKVRILLARGSKGGKFRSLGSVKIRRHQFDKRFRISRTGVYRVRLRYRGNALVAPGIEQHKIRITRRVAFRSASLER